MRNLLRLLVLIPLAGAAIVFALANRETVRVALDIPGDALLGWRIEAPLFVIVFAAMACGVVIGGMASWLAQGGHRKAERFHRAEARRLRDELDGVRQTTPRIEQR